MSSEGPTVGQERRRVMNLAAECRLAQAQGRTPPRLTKDVAPSAHCDQAFALKPFREPTGTVRILRPSTQENPARSKMGLSPSPRRFSDRLLMMPIAVTCFEAIQWRR